MNPMSGEHTSRREFLTLAGTAVALGALPTFSAAAAPPERPRTSPLVPESSALTLWYPAPAAADAMIQEGLPVGNGRLAALVGGDPARERLLVTDGTMWTGGRNDVLDGDGQFPYSATDFGTFTLLAELVVDVPAHAAAAVSGYRRTLDLANGLVTASYVHDGVTYRREVFASHPDDVIVIRMTQSGGGGYTGTITLAGTHGETAAADPATRCASFGAAFDNGLEYGAAVTATGGTVTGSAISFTACPELTVEIGRAHV